MRTPSNPGRDSYTSGNEFLFQNQNITGSIKNTPIVTETHRIISEPKQLKPTVYTGQSPSMKQQKPSRPKF